MVSAIPRRPARLIAAACSVCAVVTGFALGTAPAEASTLAYVKDGAVWVSAPDGSDAHEVGTGLSYPALTDNGTVYALAGNDQVAVLPPGEPARPSIAIAGAGAEALSVSPDGSELAWGDLQEGLNDIQDGVSVLRVADGRRSDILSDSWPVWFSDTQMTTGGPLGGDLYDASTDQETRAVWPDDETPGLDTNVDEYAIDRSATKGAGVIDVFTGGGVPNPNTHTLVVFPVSNDTPAEATGQFCVIDHSATNPVDVRNLTWSPDGSMLAWQEPDGVHEVSLPTTTDCGQIPAAQLVIPGAAEPSWGPSDDRRFPEPTAPPPGPSPGPSPHPKPITQKLTGLSLPHRLTAAAFVKHGLTLHVKCPVTGTLTATATAARTTTRKQHLPQATVGTGTARVKHAGAVTLVLRAAKRDAKRLRRSHGIPLTIGLHIQSLHTTVRFTLR